MTVEFAKWWLSEWKIIIVSKVRYVRNQWMNELMKYTKMSIVNLMVVYIQEKLNDEIDDKKDEMM